MAIFGAAFSAPLALADNRVFSLILQLCLVFVQRIFLAKKRTRLVESSGVKSLHLNIYLPLKRRAPKGFGLSKRLFHGLETVQDELCNFEKQTHLNGRRATRQPDCDELVAQLRGTAGP